MIKQPISPRRGNRLQYELTPAEARIIEWLRRNMNPGHHWMGTIRFNDGGPVQLFEMRPVGRMPQP